MTYEYRCRDCNKDIEKDFPIGKADGEVPCPSCGDMAQRAFNSMSFILKGGGWPGKSNRMNGEMTARNKRAGERMRGNKPGVELVAYDYGDGDIRDVKDVKKVK